MAPKKPLKNTIVFGKQNYTLLNKHLEKKEVSKIFILCDENTYRHCLPIFMQELASSIEPQIIEVESGEGNKDIATCQQLWNTLSDLGGDRKSLLINLGGGIITDMGGFVASTFLRGIDFINIPTSLLGMVDAAIGGKTGVNRQNIKNQIGVFNEAVLTLVDTHYLATLPQNQMRSGLAEMLKHGLITDAAYWKKLSDLGRLRAEDLEDLIQQSMTIKAGVTAEDNREQGLRKILNYGHTLGHAIESYCLENENKEGLLHGEAIAIGMILEAYLSQKKTGLSHEECDEIKAVILHTFEKINFSKDDIQAIIKLMVYDKKNEQGHINFVLLKRIGEAEIDCEVHEKLIFEAFDYYQTDIPVK